MKLEQAIQKIKEIPNTTFNRQQKELAIKILQSSPEVEMSELFNFIIQRIKLGLTFDYVPKIAKGQISLIKELVDLNINADSTVEENENKLIIGENFDALKNLLLTHKNKIDLIYIDPPYNTETTKKEGNSMTEQQIATGGGAFSTSTKSKFIYWDKFTRTGWLNFIFERLKLAKDLLTEDGLIFVSIDDNEQAYLRVIMDEIFGEDNFLNQITWVSNKPGNQSTSKPFVETFEYVMVYGKPNSYFWQNKLSKEFLEKEMPLIYVPKNAKVVQNGDQEIRIGENLTLHPFNGNVQTRPSCRYPLFVNFKLNKIYVNKNDCSLPLVEIWPGGNKTDRVWSWSKETTKNNLDKLCLYKNTSGEISIHRKDLRNSFRVRNLILGTSINNKTGTKEVKNLGLDFDFPKPTKLLEVLFSNYKKDENITILDFFAGSGTTAHAVMKMNQKNNGARKFILVTNDENGIGRKVCYERLYRLIKGVSSDGRTWKAKDHPVYSGAKLRVFELQKHNVKLGTNINDLGMDAIKELKKLNPDFKSDNEDIYYRLSSLLQD